MIEDGTILDCGHPKVGTVGYCKRASGETLCKPCNDQRRRDAYRPEVLRRERRDLSDCIGASTMVGTIRLGHEKPPYRRGNCCDILNMYTENVDHIIKTMPTVAADCEVEVVRLNGHERVRVVDGRIPDGFKYHVCNVCNIFEDGTTPNLPQPEDVGPNDEGFSVIEVTGESRKLKSTWSQEAPSSDEQ